MQPCDCEQLNIYHIKVIVYVFRKHQNLSCLFLKTFIVDTKSTEVASKLTAQSTYHNKNNVAGPSMVNWFS